MKKMRVLFSVLAFTLAIAGAFATASAPRLVTPAYIDISGDEPVCSPAPVACPGGSNLCTKTVPGAGSQSIFDMDVDCATRLRQP